MRKDLVIFCVTSVQKTKFAYNFSAQINPFKAKFSDTPHNPSEKPFYQITLTIYLLETINKIVPYRLGKPKTFLD